MTDAAIMIGSDRTAQLRRRLGLLSHSIRWIGVIWIVWALISIVFYVGDRAAAAAIYGPLLQKDLSALPASDHALALGVLLVDWAFAAAVVVFVWQLFGHYLNGRIFSMEAVAALRCVGLGGLAAVAADILARPLLAMILSRHLGDGQPFHLWGSPHDLLHLLMALFLLVLAHVFKTGVEFADENRQIV